jgi:hypothetical protein
MPSNAIEGFLDDYADVDPFAKTVNRHPRTVRRWMNEPDGLPFTKIGNRVLIHIPTAKEWVLSRLRRPNPRTRPPRGSRRRVGITQAATA